jgi:hypothetical protein
MQQRYGLRSRAAGCLLLVQSASAVEEVTSVARSQKAAALRCPPVLMVACGDAGFEPCVALEIDDARAGQALVAEGLGVRADPALALVDRRSVVTGKLVDGPLR